EIASNLSLFPHHLRVLLGTMGRGMERAGVYVGPLSFVEISVKLPLGTYLAIMFAGLVRRMTCRLRPYEKVKGAADLAAARSLEVLAGAFRSGGDKDAAVARAVSFFEGVEHGDGFRPKVAVFGDLYVRDNEAMNQDLFRVIEENGGEVVPMPYHHYLKMIAGPYLRKWFREGKYFEAFTSEAFLLTLLSLEKKYYRRFRRILEVEEPVFDRPPAELLSEYHVRLENTGESMDNLLKVHYLLRDHPDLALFVQASPAFCCPSLVTEAMAGEIERRTGVPVVSVTYDGTGGYKNEAIVPYLKFPRRRPAQAAGAADVRRGPR
ncbi:MAG: CoA activase, partial [Thermodesulfobacteriota bacterium]